MPVKTRASRRRSTSRTPPPALLAAAQLVAQRQRARLDWSSPRRDGELLNDDNFRHRVFAPGRAPQRARPACRFHDLRHTYAALMVAAGAHPKYLQAQMGHSSIRVTLDLYGHLFPDANRTSCVSSTG